MNKYHIKRFGLFGIHKFRSYKKSLPLSSEQKSIQQSNQKSIQYDQPQETVQYDPQETIQYDQPQETEQKTVQETVQEIYKNHYNSIRNLPDSYCLEFQNNFKELET